MGQIGRVAWSIFVGLIGTFFNVLGHSDHPNDNSLHSNLTSLLIYTLFNQIVNHKYTEVSKQKLWPQFHNLTSCDPVLLSASPKNTTLMTNHLLNTPVKFENIPTKRQGVEGFFVISLFDLSRHYTTFDFLPVTIISFKQNNVNLPHFTYYQSSLFK